jgi:hypothetical protein
LLGEQSHASVEPPLDPPLDNELTQLIASPTRRGCAMIAPAMTIIVNVKATQKIIPPSAGAAGVTVATEWPGMGVPDGSGCSNTGGPESRTPTWAGV